MEHFIHPQADTLESFVSSAYAVLAKDLSYESVMRLGVTMAAVSNRFGHLSGTEKGRFVLDVLLQVLKKLESEFPEKKNVIVSVQEFVNTTLPVILAVSVDVAKGRIQFEKAVSTVVHGVSWLSCFATCWRANPVVQPVTTKQLVLADLVKEASEESKNAVFEPRKELETRKEQSVDTVEVTVPNEPLPPVAPFPVELPPLPESRSETPGTEEIHVEEQRMASSQ